MSIINAGRRFHEKAVLKDRCTIERHGEPVFNPATGTYQPKTKTVATNLPCYITPFTGARTLDEAFGGEIVVTRNYNLKLPWDAPEIRREDYVTITSSQDPGLVGRVFRVDQVDAETYQMSRRAICEAITAAVHDEDDSSSS